MRDIKELSFTKSMNQGKRLLFVLLVCLLMGMSSLQADQIPFSRVDYSDGSSPRDVALADFNGDGKLDMVTANAYSNDIGVFINKGDGTFQNILKYQAGAYPIAVVTGDFNDDGKQDIITGNYFADGYTGYSHYSISVFLGNGDGTFPAAMEYHVGRYGSLDKGDFNNDGKQDLVFINNGSQISLMLGNGDGTFQQAVDIAACGGYIQSLAVGDVNSDGKLDVVTGNQDSNYNGQDGLCVMVGNGDGTFATPQLLLINYPGSGVSKGVRSLVIADLNHDNIPDLIASVSGFNYNYKYLYVFKGIGGGAFEPGVSAYGIDNTWGSLAAQDINGDNNIDLIGAYGYGQKLVSVILGHGLIYDSLPWKTAFSPPINYEMTDYPMALALGDVNNDGDLDIVTANLGNSVSVFLNRLNAKSSIVRIQDRQIKVQKRMPDGTLDIERPYFIQGVAWQPATSAPEMGPDPANPSGQAIPYGFFYDAPERMFYWWQQEMESHYVADIALMKEMNVNTVRLYINPGEDGVILTKAGQILDELYNNGIMVIMTVANSKADLTSDPPKYEPIVTKFKNHPAILMWSLGNEWNFSIGGLGFNDLQDAKTLINGAAQAIKSLDSNHPVTSALGDDFSAIPEIVTDISAVDIWGLNVYRGASFESPADIFYQWGSNTIKPFYFSEYGTDSFASTSWDASGYRAYNVSGVINESSQASFVGGLHNEIVHHQAKEGNAELCNGGIVFEFNDSIWKAGNYHVGLGGMVGSTAYAEYNADGFIEGGQPDGVSNQEYFGIVNADRSKKAVFSVLKDGLVTNTSPGTAIPYTDTNSNANLTFAEVVSPGHTAVSTSASGPTPPSGFQLLNTYYDITTTSAFSGQIKVCLGYSDAGLSQQDEQDLRLFHFEGSSWVDVTTLPNDIVNNTVCGEVASLSPFAVMKVNHPPVAYAGNDQKVEGTGFYGAKIVLSGSDSFDPDGDQLSFKWQGPFPEGNGVVTGATPTITLPLGKHTITLTVSDPYGGTASDEMRIIVVDTAPPQLHVSVTPDTLWPPNHKMVLVTPTIAVNDICDPHPAVTLTSITMKDGNKVATYYPPSSPKRRHCPLMDDIRVDEAGHIYLRAERSGRNSRQYVLEYTAVDASGNSAVSKAVVTVPHNR